MLEAYDYAFTDIEIEVLKTGIMNLINQYENGNKKNMAMLEVLNEEINTKLNKEKTKKLD